MPTKNESLWLAAGQSGENQARALNQAIEFTRVVIGDANGNYPPMDSAINALVNERLEGEILSHIVDPDNVNQRIVEMSIPPTLDFDAVELMLFAKYGETEFAHTYFRLAAPFPVRTIENGGSQAKLKYTIRVSQYSDFSIFVSPNLSYVSEESLKNDFKPMTITGDAIAVTDKSKLHTFTNFADLTIPDDAGELFFVKVDKSVDLTAGKCRILNANGDKLEVNQKLVDAANIVEKGVTFSFTKINGVWQA